MSLVRTLPDGKSRIIKDQAFCILLHGKLPPNSKSFTELFLEFNEEIKRVDSKVTTGALNNVHGDWYEWLLAIAAWNYCSENTSAHMAFPLPNIRRFDVSELYNEKLYNLLIDLRQKVAASASVQLITSNPDFVIIRRKLVQEIIGLPDKIQNIDKTILSQLEDKYTAFKGKCGFEDIVGFISVKASLRPDRRLQIPHEGSLMKALYAHLQTRQWIINPPGLKYYAISAGLNGSDKKALKTIATHSLTAVCQLPQAAVDEVFKVDSLNEARMVFETILA